MGLRIEDYALIGSTRTAALVGNHGSIDWLCVPRCAAPACCAALLCDENNGRWLIAPAGEVKRVRRRYRDATLIRETAFQTEAGIAAVIDFMPGPRDGEQTDVVGIVEGRAGAVPMRTELTLRFDYGSILPWLRRREYGLRALAGPHAVRVQAPFELANRGLRNGPAVGEADQDLNDCETWWHDWAARCTYEGGRRAQTWTQGWQR